MLVSTEETIDAEIACQVLSDNISTIIKAQIDLPHVLEKLLAKKVISDADERKIMDTKNTLNIVDRWKELLRIVQATIDLNAKVFQIFLNAIKDGGSLREQILADNLYKVINMLYIVTIFNSFQKYKSASKK